MNEREKTIRLWFDMWLNQQDMGIDDIFTEDVIYTESWSPQYNNRKTVKHWFQEWNICRKCIGASKKIPDKGATLKVIYREDRPSKVRIEL
mgnify:CR=1 FL=1